MYPGLAFPESKPGNGPLTAPLTNRGRSGATLHKHQTLPLLLSGASTPNLPNGPPDGLSFSPTEEWNSEAAGW